MTEREIARAQNVEIWKDEKTQEKKNGIQWLFVSILILVMIEDEKG
jgi:predicted nucleic acid-binding Zn ribbon protein